MHHQDSHAPNASAPAAAPGQGEAAAPSPLLMWRTAGESAIDPCALEPISATLARLHVLHEPCWRKALAEDVAAAIGIAMRNLIPGRDGGVGLLDVVMSAVLVHAARGNATANLILEQGRKCI